MMLKKTTQSTSSFKTQNNLNFNNSWRCAQQMEEHDISSHFERKNFLNANFGFFEGNGRETKKNCEDTDFGRVNNSKLQEKLQEEDDNLQSFNLEKFKKSNNFSLFSTKMLMTTMNDLGNKDGLKDQMSHSSYKNDLMSIGVNEVENNLKNEINRTPTTNIMPKKKKKKPYKELTLEQKVELIRLAERCTNLSQASIAERYAIAKSNVCRILQRKTEYVRALECAGFAGSRKRKLRTAINLGEENLELINGEMKNNKNIGGGRGGRNNNLFVDVEEEEELNNNNCFNILCDKKDIDKLIEGSWKNEEIGANLDLNGNEEDDKWFLSGTSALSSHMSTVHCQKSRRVILCRCCNLAFRDKNELHKHLKNRNNLPNDGTSSEDVLLPTIENHHPPNSPENNQTSQHENTNGEQIEKINNSKNSSKIQVVESSNRTNENVEDNSTITSAFQLLQQQQQHFILANLWSNIFSRQLTEQNTQENTTININNCNNENGMVNK
uniref:HTH psq-type domain-containing protein n=1 Tax=Meloidogyne incognita TaxID=6306 RepID=A0A914KJT1_MELIC